MHGIDPPVLEGDEEVVHVLENRTDFTLEGLMKAAYSTQMPGFEPIVPALIRADRDRLARTYLEGAPMHRAKPADPGYFRHALRLLRRLHAHGVVHNDLAKEPNLLVTAGGFPAFVDFQMAWRSPGRGRLFRILGYDDLRHLLKHKRSYCAAHLTERQRRILATPSLPSRLWMRIVKPPYLFVTRRLLGWADREGASDRGEQR